MKKLDPAQRTFELEVIERMYPTSAALRADEAWVSEQRHHANGFCSCPENARFSGQEDSTNG